MEFDKNLLMSESEINDSLITKNLLEKHLRNIRWYILSIVLCFLISIVYVKFQEPKFNSSATILIKDNDKGGSISGDLEAIESLGLIRSNDRKLDDELQILKSRKLITKVVKELNLHVSCREVNLFYDSELYPNFPITYKINEDSLNKENFVNNFRILLISNEQFEFFTSEEESLGIKKFNEYFSFQLDQTDRKRIKILKTDYFDSNLIDKEISISISSVNSIVNFYIDQIHVEPIKEGFSKVVKMSLNTVNKEKGNAVLNNLIEQYNAQGIEDENLISQSTTNFLDSRLEIISTELEAIEFTVQNFKTKNKIIDVDSGGDIYLQSSSNAESDMVIANTQLQLANYMLEELRDKGINELLPGNIGLAEPSTLVLITDYNNLILRRNRILKSSSSINPIVVNIDSQLNVLRSNLTSSLETLISSLIIKANAVSNQSVKINSRIAQAPKNEKEYTDIKRMQETKNALFLYLLQKREESIISNAVNLEKAKIIDSAYSSGYPISPKKKYIYIASIMIGFIIPALVIFLIETLDTKVHDENDIKQLRIPFIGDIPLGKKTTKLVDSLAINSNVTEAFRFIRTNINFILDHKILGKTIFVTSTESHEGKTFTAINLANALAVSGKKTILVAMDLRAPLITKYLDLDNKKGITNYIIDSSIKLENLIFRFGGNEGFDILQSGDIPPNPVELLMSKRVDEIFNFLKEKYEYIIVDTAPVGLVTDTIQIAKYSDLSIYVIRANKLDKRKLHIPLKLFREERLPKMALILNGIDQEKSGYGYGYGYGQHTKKKKWWI